MKYDGAKGFVPISRWSSAPMLLAVNKDVSAKTVQALIAEARQNPGKLALFVVGHRRGDPLAGLSLEKSGRRDDAACALQGRRPVDPGSCRG